MAASFSTSVGHVLVVDDSALSRAALVHRLQSEGHTVCVAENGPDALSCLCKEDFDVVLLDVRMPGMDGCSVLQKMKQDAALRDIPVLMVSAEEEFATVVRSIEAGAEDYLVKPPDPVLLRARLDVLIERKRLRDQDRRRTEELRSAVAEGERLLLNVLPEQVANELRTRGEVLPRRLEDATVICASLVGFTEAACRHSPDQLFQNLTRTFNRVDGIVQRYGLEKIRTAGGSYLCAAGVPEPVESHVVDAVRAALDIAALPSPLWQVRLGVHCGPVMAGVVGIHRFCYDVCGETVSMAARIESHGLPGRVSVSETVQERVRDFFTCTPGEKDTYFVENAVPGWAERYRQRFGHALD